MTSQYSSVVSVCASNSRTAPVICAPSALSVTVWPAALISEMITWPKRVAGLGSKRIYPIGTPNAAVAFPSISISFLSSLKGSTRTVAGGIDYDVPMPDDALCFGMPTATTATVPPGVAQADTAKAAIRIENGRIAAIMGFISMLPLLSSFDDYCGPFASTIALSGRSKRRSPSATVRLKWQVSCLS